MIESNTNPFIACEAANLNRSIETQNMSYVSALPTTHDELTKIK